MIESKLKRELNHHYLVIQATEQTSYELQMLLHNKIKGILKFKLHITDNENEYYYEITDQKSLVEIYDKKSMNFNDIKNVILNIISSVETGEEYLLNPNSFVLAPEYIYLSNDQSKVDLCYLPNYNNGIKDQVSTLIEYLMNKINHMDEKAVVLIYGLYKISREENCTFKNLKQFIQTQECPVKASDFKETYPINQEEVLKNRNSMEQELIDFGQKGLDKKRFTQKSSDNNSSKSMPFMENKIQNEVEIRIYPLYIKISAFLTCLFSCSIIIVLIKSEILINRITNEVDMTKAIGIFAVLFSTSGYICSRLFSKENKRSKMMQIVEYKEVTQKDLPQNSMFQNSISQNSMFQNNISPNSMSQNNIPQNNISQNNVSHNYSVDISSDNNKKENNEKAISSKSIYSPNTPPQNNNLHTFESQYHESEDTIDATCLLTLPETHEEKTTILNQVDQQYPMLELISLKPQKYKDITITKFPCHLGTNNELSDYIIDNKAVSRCHIKIEINKTYNKESNQNPPFLISDLHSTNGTKINNQPLNHDIPYIIKEKDTISIADYQYQIKITPSVATS